MFFLLTFSEFGVQQIALSLNLYILKLTQTIIKSSLFLLLITYYKIGISSMKELNQINRVNYANTKHHRQLIRENINPQLISQIQTSSHPSLNYQSAFKNAYIEELQKTVLYQQQKKQAQITLSPTQSFHNLLSPSYGSPTNSKMGIGKAYYPFFTDFEEERRKKFDNLINRGCQQGGLLFKAQDQYQNNKNFQAQMTKSFLKQQLQLKDQRKYKQNLEKSMIQEEARRNRIKQIELQQQRTSRLKEERLNQARCLQDMMQKERERRERKSLFKLGGQGRHNPITNPIEYHIDNPYILHKMQRNMLG